MIVAKSLLDQLDCLVCNLGRVQSGGDQAADLNTGLDLADPLAQVLVGLLE